MKKIVKILLSGLTIFFLVGCATSYQSEGAMGGFKETRLSENMYRVTFNGNGFTDRTRSADFVLLRSAEITLQNGYRYFTIIDAHRDTATSYHTNPTYTTVNANTYGNTMYGTATTYGGGVNTITKPSNSNTIVMYKKKPKGLVYDAKFINISFKNKYKLNKVEKV